MEAIAPPLALVMEIKQTLSRGGSLREALTCFIEENNCEFAAEVRFWFLQVQRGKRGMVLQKKSKSLFRKIIFDVFEMGLTGLPIREVIIQLERELREECLRELDLAYRQMPFKALIPLLFFQFPALLLLVLGPIVKEFVFGIGNA